MMHNRKHLKSKYIPNHNPNLVLLAGEPDEDLGGPPYAPMHFYTMPIVAWEIPLADFQDDEELAAEFDYNDDDDDEMPRIETTAAYAKPVVAGETYIYRTEDKSSEARGTDFVVLDTSTGMTVEEHPVTREEWIEQTRGAAKYYWEKWEKVAKAFYQQQEGETDD